MSIAVVSFVIVTFAVILAGAVSVIGKKTTTEDYLLTRQQNVGNTQTRLARPGRGRANGPNAERGRVGTSGTFAASLH